MINSIWIYSLLNGRWNVKPFILSLNLPISASGMFLLMASYSYFTRGALTLKGGTHMWGGQDPLFMPLPPFFRPPVMVSLSS